MCRAVAAHAECGPGCVWCMLLLGLSQTSLRVSAANVPSAALTGLCVVMYGAFGYAMSLKIQEQLFAPLTPGRSRASHLPPAVTPPSICNLSNSLPLRPSWGCVTEGGGEGERQCQYMCTCKSNVNTSLSITFEYKVIGIPAAMLLC